MSERVYAWVCCVYVCVGLQLYVSILCAHLCLFLCFWECTTVCLLLCVYNSVWVCMPVRVSVRVYAMYVCAPSLCGTVCICICIRARKRDSGRDGNWNPGNGGLLCCRVFQPKREWFMIIYDFVWNDSLLQQFRNIVCDERRVWIKMWRLYFFVFDKWDPRTGLLLPYDTFKYSALYLYCETGQTKQNKWFFSWNLADCIN